MVETFGCRIHNAGTALGVLQYKDTVTQLDPTEAVVKATPTAGYTGTPWERTLAQMKIGR